MKSAKLGSRGIHHAHRYGLREGPGGKYAFLKKHTVRDTNWQELQPDAPFYLFAPQNIDLRKEYDRGWKITDVMPVNGVGMTTARDHMVIDFEAEPLIARARQFRNFQGSDAQLCAALSIPMKMGWDIARSRRMMREESESHLPSYVRPITYRPFDNRLIFYHDAVVWRTVKKIMRHMSAGKNVGMIFMRQVALDEPYSHFCCTPYIIDNRAFYSNRGIMSLAPLYLYPLSAGESDDMFDRSGENRKMQTLTRRPNLAPKFLDDLTKRLRLVFVSDGQSDLKKTFGPEDVFHYAYGVFHSPAYRDRYAQFLKMDFPRLPLTGSLDLFRALARLGGELVALHLLESPTLANPRTEFIGGRHPVVEKVSWSRQAVWIDKAQTTGFRGVPEAVWSFHIGGYQVCEKWLKDRKGRALVKDDIAHYHKIVIALSETIRLMAEIDKVIERHGGWPGAFSATPS